MVFVMCVQALGENRYKNPSCVRWYGLLSVH
jgi:hypothetical protein